MGIDELILEGKSLIQLSNEKELQSEYGRWQGKIRVYMKEAGFSDKEQEEIKVKMYYTENEFSETDTILSIKKSLRNTIQILEEKVMIYEKESSKCTELLFIEKILNHFYMYYRAMFKNPVHRKGTLNQESLNAIHIGNEYDLQRMLYSVLLPAFPSVRQEVYSDNGYGGMRADLFLDVCNLIIEIKCTRTGMSEKKLLEELGADGFHYKADFIYFFVCDKNDIIKNPEAFKKAFERQGEKDGRTVKVFILQSIEL